jgi:hypothetical protein
MTERRVKGRERVPEKMVPVRVPESLRQRAKVLAAKSRRRLQDVLTEALEAGLKGSGA